MHRAPPRPTHGIPLGVLLSFYGLMLAAALGWGAIAGNLNIFLNRGQADAGVLNLERDLLLGLCCGLAFVFASRLLETHIPALRRMGDHFAVLVGRLSLPRILLVALISATVEEAFFRGAMQPTLGLWPTAVIFALLHPSLEHWPWTLSAFLVGLVFGWQFEWTGNLAAPVLTHFLINALNLHHIVKTRHGVA